MGGTDVRPRRIAPGEGGQAALVMLLLVGVPLFIYAMAYAVGFGAVYLQRSEYSSAANLAAEAGFACASQSAVGGSGSGGSGGVVQSRGGSSVSNAPACAQFWAAATLLQNVQNDHLAYPSSVSQGYVLPNSPNPCGTTLSSESYYVQFTGQTKPVLFGGAAFGIGTQAYPVCGVASLQTQGG